jgi:hypothetical protein
MRSECGWVYRCEYPSVYRGEPARGCAVLRCSMCRVATCAALEHVLRCNICRAARCAAPQRAGRTRSCAVGYATPTRTVGD